MKQTLYELLFQFVQYNWRYFFRSSVTAAKSRAEAVTQHVDNQSEFVAIIQVISCSAEHFVSLWIGLDTGRVTTGCVHLCVITALNGL